MKREYDLRHARRGAVMPVPASKSRIHVHLDHDILNWLRAQVHATGGGDYEETINQILREYMARQPEPRERGRTEALGEPTSRRARRVTLSKRSA